MSESNTSKTAQRVFGLIGRPLGHSFSRLYFTSKFEREGISDAGYQLFELPEIGAFPGLLNQIPNLAGLNVTIPYKQQVIPFLNGLDASAQLAGAVNVIKFTEDNGLIGYNSDMFGFLLSLQEQPAFPKLNNKALILGSGGGSKAVKAALGSVGFNYTTVTRNQVSGSNNEALLLYSALSPEIVAAHSLIVNCTPLGMHPDVSSAPEIPYEALGPGHLLFDLVYNPPVTEFMKRGLAMGASAVNGQRMLELQAEKAWEIWNS
ncbi:MAG: shikimate dehydrogenase [Bacteroidota bacterium]